MFSVWVDPWRIINNLCLLSFYFHFDVNPLFLYNWQRVIKYSSSSLRTNSSVILSFAAGPSHPFHTLSHTGVLKHSTHSDDFHHPLTEELFGRTFKLSLSFTHIPLIIRGTKWKQKKWFCPSYYSK